MNYAFKIIDACPKCEGEFGLFRWRRACTSCGKNFCSNCIMTPSNAYYCYAGFKPNYKYFGKYICPTCWEREVGDFHRKYSSLVADINSKAVDPNSVRVYMEAYQGKIPVNGGSPTAIITGTFFREKKDCMDQLKFTALMDGYNLVYGVKTDKQIANEGNYYYSLWRMRGILAKKL